MRVQTSKFDWVAWVLTDAFASERGAWCACLAGPHTMERRFCCSCAALRRALADFERLLLLLLVPPCAEPRFASFGAQSVPANRVDRRSSESASEGQGSRLCFHTRKGLMCVLRGALCACCMASLAALAARRVSAVESLVANRTRHAFVPAARWPLCWRWHSNSLHWRLLGGQCWRRRRHQ